MNNESKNHIGLGILIGLAAGAGIGYYFARKNHHEEQNGKSHKMADLFNVLTEVAFAKGMEALEELKERHKQSQQESTK